MGSGEEIRLAWDVMEITDRFLRISQRRVDNIFDSIDKVFSSLPYVCARDLASLAGKIISMYPVVGAYSHSLDPDIYLWKL